MSPGDLQFHSATLLPPLKGSVTPQLAFTTAGAYDLSAAANLGPAQWGSGGFVTLIADADMVIGFGATDDHASYPIVLSGGSVAGKNTGWPLKKNVPTDFAILGEYPWLHGIAVSGTANVQVFKSSARGDCDPAIVRPAGT